jgi:hypothetical protein
MIQRIRQQRKVTMDRFPAAGLREMVPHLPEPKPLVTNMLLALLLVVLLAVLRVWGPQERFVAPAVPETVAGKPASEPIRLPGGEQVTDQAAGQVRQRFAAPPAGGQPDSTPSALSRLSAPAARSVTSRGFVLAGDSINGEPITDRDLVERIERIAAAVPLDLLAGEAAAPHVRYVAHGFGGGDDAPIYYGVFREPAAALAFGCALDEHFAQACEPAPLITRAASHEDPPGVHCRPVRLAMGAPVYEPDRCESGG